MYGYILPYMMAVLSWCGRYFLGILCLLVSIKHYLNSTAYLSIWLITTIPLWPEWTNLLIAASTSIACYVTELTSSQTVLTWPPQSPHGMEDLHHGYAAGKCAANVWCCHVSIDPLLNLCYVELRQFWSPKSSTAALCVCAFITSLL